MNTVKNRMGSYPHSSYLNSRTNNLLRFEDVFVPQESVEQESVEFDEVISLITS